MVVDTGVQIVIGVAIVIVVAGAIVVVAAVAVADDAGVRIVIDVVKVCQRDLPTNSPTRTIKMVVRIDLIV